MFWILDCGSEITVCFTGLPLCDGPRLGFLGLCFWTSFITILTVFAFPLNSHALTVLCYYSVSVHSSHSASTWKTLTLGAAILVSPVYPPSRSFSPVHLATLHTHISCSDYSRAPPVNPHPPTLATVTPREPEESLHPRPSLL